MKLNLARTITRCPACAGMNSQGPFPAHVRRQKPLQGAPPLRSAVMTHGACCGASEALETQSRMASWRPWVRHEIIIAGGSDFRDMVDDGMKKIMPADSAGALQLFTFTQP